MRPSADSGINLVTASLTATYNLGPANAQSVSSIDYLCVYAYEFNGKKYTYRTHHKDNFSPVAETLELCFTKDPQKAYPAKHAPKNNYVKPASHKNGFVLITIGLIGIGFLLLYAVYDVLKDLLAEGINIPFLVIFACLLFLINRSIFKEQRKKKNLDALLEEAMINNRTAIAYLTKTRYRRSHDESNSHMEYHYKQYPYTGKYTYTYNGKNYCKTFPFSQTPPKSIRLFFKKNPKNVIHFTWNR